MLDISKDLLSVSLQEHVIFVARSLGHGPPLGKSWCHPAYMIICMMPVLMLCDVLPMKTYVFLFLFFGEVEWDGFHRYTLSVMSDDDMYVL